MMKVTIKNCVLYRGDCRDVIPTRNKWGRALVTDPPYGAFKWGGGHKKWPLKDECTMKYSHKMNWDKRPDPEWFCRLVSQFKYAVVWGGYYFNLPVSRGWLVWDKKVREFTSGHCELAWSNLDQPIRAFNYSHGQLATEKKKHPTQKPLPLMVWCLSFLPPKISVFDPYMGVGTTGVACARLGNPFRGVEKRRNYFDDAVDRIRAEIHSPRLFRD